MLSRRLPKRILIPKSPMRARLAQMAAQISNGSSSGYTLRELPKTNVFTRNLPPDSSVPTPKKSHSLPRDADELTPRMVKNAMYTFVRPENTQSPELLGVSRTAMKDLGIREGDEKTEEFKQTMAGNMVISLEDDGPEAEIPDDAVYPWAQCYGGYQFGQWAGQLGDGRAISLFETKKKTSKEPWEERYELQLKGAGMTPYSRFADGKAVLRSSIREFVVSEYLNSLGIPTTRALSLTLAPKAKVQRERIEPGAIVCRFAETWLRIGTFDLLRARGDRKLLRQLAEYVAVHVYGGWDNLPSKLPSKDGENIEASQETLEAKETTNSGSSVPTTKSSVVDGATATDDIQTGIDRLALQGEGKFAENRFTRLYRQIVRRNAKTVAMWQTYGFTNGVLNTDNTSIYGLSVDFGPFAFLDVFDPSYTPNHDDHMLRYAYKNQPTIIWWNLVRLGEAFGELIGAGSRVDEELFVEKGIEKDWADELVERAETLIGAAGEEYKAVFMEEYKRGMTKRLGLKESKESDFNELYSEILDCMEAYELDFNQTFRKLGSFTVKELATEEGRKEKAAVFFRKDQTMLDSAASRIGEWLEKWKARVVQDWGEGKDSERKAAMDAVNPKVTISIHFWYMQDH
jgi:uncharacterized protein YdiU (UPF0061 family)